ncbi:MAG: hypothetical protein IJ229_13130 [Clostridia bacterium]|nr:hypothetical protein [Clostridia bacterium]
MNMQGKRLLALFTAMCLLLPTVAAGAETVKHQRVYSVIGTDGTIRELVDNVYLQNTDALDTIEDRTSLEDIENLGGDQEYAHNGNTLIWQADGGDIVYQGNGKAALPLRPEVIFLDAEGRKLTQAEAAGADVVTMRVTYAQTQQLPMLCVCVIPLPYGTQVLEAEYATSVAMGNSTLLLGFSLPGLDARLKVPGDFEAKLKLSGEAPSWVMAFGTTQVAEKIVSSLGDSFDDAGSLSQDLRALLLAVRNGEDLPEVQNAKLAAFVEEWTSALTAEVKEEKPAEETTYLAESVESFLEKIGNLAAEQTSVSDGAADLAEDTEMLKQSAKAIAEDTEKLGSTLAEAWEASEMKAAAEEVADHVSSLTQDLEKVEKSGKDSSKKAGELKEHLIGLAESAQEAQSGTKALLSSLEGTKEWIESLKNGIETLKNGEKHQESGDKNQNAAESGVNGGIVGLADSASALKSGAEDLLGRLQETQKAAESLQSGIEHIDNATNELKSGTDALHDDFMTLEVEGNSLKESAEAMFAALLAQTNVMLSQLELEEAGVEVPELTRDNYGEAIDHILSQLDPEHILNHITERAGSQVWEALAEQQSELTATVWQQVEARLLSIFLSREGLTTDAASFQLDVENGKIPETTAARIRDELETKLQDEEIVQAVEEQVSGQIDLLYAQQMTDESQMADIQAAAEGYDTAQIFVRLQAAKVSLEKADVLVGQMTSYLGSVEQAGESVGVLYRGITELAGNAEEIGKTSTAVTSASGADREAALSLHASSQKLEEEVGRTVSALGSLEASADSLEVLFTESEDQTSSLDERNKQLIEEANELATDADALLAALESGTGAVKTLAETIGTLSGLPGSHNDALGAREESAENASAQLSLLISKVEELVSTADTLTEKAQAVEGTAQSAVQLAGTVSDDARSLAEVAQDLYEGAANRVDKSSERMEKLIDMLLPRVEESLGWALEIYQKTQAQLASYANYDLLGPDMSGDTVYLIRVDLK